MATYSFSFGGVDFEAYGLIVARGAKPFFPEVSRPAVSLGSGDGEAAGRSRFGGREISLDCVVCGSSHADLLSKMDLIAKALYKREDEALILDAAPERYWLARLVKAPEWSPVTASRADVTLTFASAAPFAFATAESSAAVSLTLDGAAVVCAVGGNAEAWPTIDLTLNAGTASWGIENEALDLRLAWNASPTALVAGDKIQIVCDPVVQDAYGDPTGGQLLKIQHASEALGVVRNAGIEGHFPQLSPCVAGGGTLTFWGLRGSGTVKWRNRWLG